MLNQKMTFGLHNLNDYEKTTKSPVSNELSHAKLNLLEESLCSSAFYPVWSYLGPLISLYLYYISNQAVSQTHTHNVLKQLVKK